MLKNFLELAAQWNAARGAQRTQGCIEETVVSDDFKGFIAKVAAGAALTRDEAAHAFDRMMSGEATPSQMGGLLMALRVRGETVDEITGAVTDHARQDAEGRGAAGRHRRGRHRRRRLGLLQHLDLRGAASWPAPACRSPSTATARCRRSRARPTCSARSASRSSCARTRSPAASTRPASASCSRRRIIRRPRTSAPTRVELGTRTIFNLLGPLSNPAGVKRQMIGVFSRQWIEPMAQVLEELSAPNASGWRTAPTASTRSRPPGPTAYRGAGERHGPHLRDQAGGHRHARAPSPRRCRAATPRPMPRR